MDSFRQDIRYALRGLRRAPAFTFVALATLALGIGINSAIFSIVSAVLLKPLPVSRPAELLNIYGHDATSPSHETSSYPNYLAYREQNTTLSGLVGFSNFFAHMSSASSSEIVVGELVTDNYFSVLGVRTALGRSFTPDEYSAQGGYPVAVISDRLWRNRFAGAPGVIGKTFRMNGVVYTVVGVAPPEFNGMRPAVTAQMWIPTAMVEKVEPFGNQRSSGKSTGATRLERRGQHWMSLIGRMKPSATVADVRTELEAIAKRLAAEYSRRTRTSAFPSFPRTTSASILISTPLSPRRAS
jgi:hypothetical protein